MSEVMPELTSRHERSALKTHVLLLKSPGQQKAKQRVRVFSGGEQYLHLNYSHTHIDTHILGQYATPNS